MQISVCSKSDYDQIVSHIVEFWGSDRTLGLHHPMFIHEFGKTAFVIKEGETVAAYLFGFFSQSEPVAYVHLVGVRDSYRRRGLARQLYQHFSDYAASHGCSKFKAVTVPANRDSIEFHKAFGFRLLGKTNSSDIPVVANYAGPQQDRVVFEMPLKLKKDEGAWPVGGHTAE